MASSLDTSLWNLTLAAGATSLVACGPLVPFDMDTDGDDDGSDTTQGSTPTGTTRPPPTQTDTVGPGCGPDNPCPAGYSCYDGICNYDYDCDSCCEGDCGYYYQCYTHDECGAGLYCDYNYCNTAPTIPACDPGMALSTMLVPAAANDAPALSLAFADGDGDGFDDLVVLAPSELWFLPGPDAGTATSTILPGLEPGGFVAAADIDGSPPIEFVTSFPQSESVIVWSMFGGLINPWATALASLDWPVSGDFDGDGRDDLAGLTDQSLVTLFSQGGSLGDPEFYGLPTAVPPAVGNLGDAPGEDLAVANGLITVAQAMPGGGSFGPVDEPYPLTNRTPVVGDFDADGDDDIVALGSRGGVGALIATWNHFSPGAFDRMPYTSAPSLELSADGFFAVDVGDVDGDGADDAVVGGVGKLTILFGAVGQGGLFGCYADVPIKSTARHVALGDIDGNGLADAAYADGITIVAVLRSN